MRYEDDAVSEDDDTPIDASPVSEAFAVQTSHHGDIASLRGRTTETHATEEYGGELLSTKTLDAFIASLYTHEDFRGGELMLGISAGEFENAALSFVNGIFTESIEQHVFPSDEVVASKIARFVSQLGLPDDPRLHAHIAALLRATYLQKKTPEMLEPLRGEFVRALNETQNIEDFEHLLYQELPPERASYISRRLQHILQGTALHFAEGLDVQDEPAVFQYGEWWNDPSAEAYLAKILQEYAPLPLALSSAHLARLLLDWTFREEQVLITPNVRTPQQPTEASRVVKGMEEFDELRPPKKSEDVFARNGYLDI